MKGYGRNGVRIVDNQQWSHWTAVLGGLNDLFLHQLSMYLCLQLVTNCNLTNNTMLHSTGKRVSAHGARAEHSTFSLFWFIAAKCTEWDTGKYFADIGLCLTNSCAMKLRPLFCPRCLSLPSACCIWVYPDGVYKECIWSVGLVLKKSCFSAQVFIRNLNSNENMWEKRCAFILSHSVMFLCIRRDLWDLKGLNLLRSRERRPRPTDFAQ